MKLTVIQRGYIAGLIDGEGTVGVNSVSICNTDRTVMYWLQALIGGKMTVKWYREGKYKTCYILSLRAEEQAMFLPQIIPHLIIKKEAAIKRLAKAQETMRKRHESTIQKFIRLARKEYPEFSAEVREKKIRRAFK